MTKTPQMLELQAEKKMKRFLFMRPGQLEYEDASKLFEVAANKYKINKQFLEAGKAFEKSANALELGKSEFYAVSKQLFEAAKVYKNVSNNDYMRCLNKVIGLEVEDAQIHQAAGHLKQAAESALELGDYDNAIDYFNRASEYFALEDTKTSVSQINMQLAVIYSLHKNDYAKAAQKYEGLARGYLETNITRFSAKEVLFKAGLCHILLKDYQAAHQKVTSYEQLDPNFSNSQEQKLLNSLIQALEEGDEQSFQNAVQEYDAVHRLDSWKVQMLSRLRLFFKQDETVVLEGVL